MLVLIIAMLAMLALMATAFLVTTRYDQVSTAGLRISNQMEILLSILEDGLSRKLAEDLWGDDAGANNPGEDAHEAYDGPDPAHAWLRGLCGELIDWQTPDAGPVDHVQYVVAGDGDWHEFSGADADGLAIRYAVLIQDLGGLVNVNVARRPDPDTLGQGFAESPGTTTPEQWPYTLWAFHAQRGKPDWGYWWYTPQSRFTGSTPVPTDYLMAMGKPFRGGGPLAQVNLRALLGDPDELPRIDEHFRKSENYSRSLDILDELDLRFPGDGDEGAPYPSKLQLLLPSLFDGRRRRLVTAVGRTTGWQRRREPILTHPYPENFWTQVAADYADRAKYPTDIHFNKDLCDEAWYYRFDYAHYDDLIKYLTEARMGYRLCLGRGMTLWHMWPNDPLNIYNSIDLIGRWDMLPLAPQVGRPRYANPTHSDFPGVWKYTDPDDASQTMRYVSTAPPFQWDQWLTDYVGHVTGEDSSYGNRVYSSGGYNGPSALPVLLANVMAIMGVPDPEDDPDQAATYTPQPYAHRPWTKSQRVRAYRRLAGTMHLNLADFQDTDNLPGTLRTTAELKDGKWITRMNRFSRHGDKVGDEGLPYLSEVVMEFEVWPDYVILGTGRRPYQYNATSRRWETIFGVTRIDANSPAGATGLAQYDKVLKVRTPQTGGVFQPVSGNLSSEAVFRSYLKPLKPGEKIDLMVLRPIMNAEGNRTSEEATPREILNIPLGVVVRTIALEVYNPSDKPIVMYDDRSLDQRSGVTEDGKSYPIVAYPIGGYRINAAVRQQQDNTGRRAFVNRFNGYSYGESASYSPRTLAGGKCMLYIESRGVESTPTSLEAEMNGPNYRLNLSNTNAAAVPYTITNIVPGTYYYGVIPGEQNNLLNLRRGEDDGHLLLTINRFMVGRTSRKHVAYLLDAVRPRAQDAAGNALAAPPMPATGATPGEPKGVDDAFETAAALINAGTPYPVVRLYRPLRMVCRATQFMTVSNSWMTGSDRSPAARRLGTRAGDEDDFAHADDDLYRNIDARGVWTYPADAAFRYAGDLSRVSRLSQPRLKNAFGLVDEYQWCWFENVAYDPVDDCDGLDPRPAWARTEVIDRTMRKFLALLPAGATLGSNTARRLLQKAEARMRFSPYSPQRSSNAEMAECQGWIDFTDAFTLGGAAYDNVDNNANAVVDEHGTHDYDLGLPEYLADNDPGGGWLYEHSNCWPCYGRINVNTAPREVLENCLMAPSSSVRSQLAAAVWNERGGEASQTNGNYRPFTSLIDLYSRVSVLNGREHGFDRYGFDGKDNHAGADRLPDMPPEMRTVIDDLDERNYLWRINSEVITLRSDTFAVYMRIQARRGSDAAAKIVAERRVYSIWDRANCLWPPKRQDGRPHPDFTPAQRLGIQVFAH